MGDGVIKMKMPQQVRLLLELQKIEESDRKTDNSWVLRRIERNLDPSLLKRYKTLRRKRGTGIALLKNGECSGCGMIYSETHDMLRWKNSIQTCELCGRLLVITEKSA